jgi:hypothetical protein
MHGAPRTSASRPWTNCHTGSLESSLNGRSIDVQDLPDSGKGIAGSILAHGSFDVRWSQFGQVHPPDDAEAFKMVGHRTAVDTELPSEFVQRTAVPVRGSYDFKLRRAQSTLDWLCRSSSSTISGGGVDAIDVGAEHPGAGV